MEITSTKSRSLLVWGIAFVILGLMQTRAGAQDNTFTVTVEDQSTSHPRYNEGYDEKFAIDGSQNPQITLERGETYYFVMDNVPSFHPFYLTTDAQGLGADSYDSGVQNNGTSGNDTLVFTPPADAPASIYYNCTNHSYMGTEMSVTGEVSQMTFNANLSGEQEVSPVVTRASGQVTATLQGSQLTVSGSFDNLSSAYQASHIHMAHAGQNGGVEIALDVTVDNDGLGGTFESANNQFSLSSSQVEALKQRRLYINVHTEDHPSGELRGQLQGDADAFYTAHITGSQVAPFGVKDRGHGRVVAERHGDSLLVSGAFTNMSSAYTMSHIHIGVAGRNGGVAHGLTANLSSSDSTAGVYSISDNRFALSSSQQTALQERRLYVNLHSSDHPASALRGQMTKQARGFFVARLSSSNQTPAFNSDGNGTVLMELHQDTLMAFGSFNSLESDFASGVAETGIHLHTAPAGRNGGVGIHLNAQASSDMRGGVLRPTNNSYELSSDQITRLYSRNYYVNVHSTEHMGGSVRGQVLGPATSYFRANLSGTHEVQPVQTMGSGALVGEMKGSMLILTGSFQGLGSSFASDLRMGSHLHAAPIDANGSIQIELNAQTGSNDTSAVYAASENRYGLSTSNANSLFAEQLYANIHSQNNLSGELRGQMRFSPNRYPDTTMISSPSDSAEVTFEGSASTDLTVEWQEVSDTDGSEVAYIWQLAGSAAFDSPMISVNVGSETMASLTYGTVDSLLADAGLAVNESATLHHRVLTSDGSLITSSEAYVLTATRGDVVVSIPEEGGQLPKQVTLDRNYPNPFNPSTTIKFGLPKAQQVQIAVYNMLGRKVATVTDRRYGAGEHAVTFNAADLSSGMYMYRLQTAGQTLTRKMTLVK